ncbi:isoprenoid biosynthesis glyoxalase ElbB [Ferrimonas sediminicola]|uniref:Glyoxalase n=1 Tax=Ferrimonas sediminicola TaxID=2569538 RepID=A0A4U1BJT6_9GAMM|nr:isoprenoid biosynthesis glyoxalase ElbB [Ferrimonas sediminicola]TKB51054.1 isoprenoid biosynthesis glyoxalase ElbB [Ferrimonas sediminicola]
MKRIAVLLSGSGVFDGSEIHESVLALLAIQEKGATYQCFAPDRTQLHVVNHLTGEVAEGESRNCLVEAARIARGEILPITQLHAADFDALVVPGGFGAAKNLCDFALSGSECQVSDDVMAVALAFAQAGKPCGYLCIAPMMLPRIYGEGVQGTIGNDHDTASAFNAMGGRHVECAVEQIHVDVDHKVVTTPAYMLAKSLPEAAAGIRALVSQVIKLCY